MFRLSAYMLFTMIFLIGCDDPPPKTSKVIRADMGSLNEMVSRDDMISPDHRVDFELPNDLGAALDLTLTLDATPYQDSMLELDQTIEFDESDAVELDMGFDIGFDLDSDLDPDPDPELPRVISRVEAQLERRSSAAGEAITIRCVAFDEMNREVNEASLIQELAPVEGWSRGPELGQYIGERVGVYQVRCIAPDLDLVSDQRDWRVAPGALAHTIASVADTQLEAGSEMQVSCTGLDTFGNAVGLEQPSITISPHDDGVTTVGDRFTATLVGEYDIRCTDEGNPNVERRRVRVTVIPSAPAQLTVRLNSARDFYRMGTRVRVLAEVRDRFNNELPSDEVILSGSPELIEISPSRYELSAEGRMYMIGSLEVNSQTGTPIEPLTDRVDFIVDRGGPDVRCDQPTYGASLRWSDSVTIRGVASDTFGVNRVQIDGVEVDVDDEGQFTHDVRPRLGLNWNRIIAEDTFGQPRETLCVYFMAYDYLSDHASLDSGVLLNFGASGLDDGEPALPIQSLADLARIKISAAEISEELNVTAQTTNPVIPDTCLSYVFSECTLAVAGRLIDVEIVGSRPLSLEVSETYGGSIRVNVRVNRIRLNFGVQRRTPTASYDTAGYLEMGFMSIDAHFALRVIDDLIDVQVIPESLSVSLGPISSNFGDLPHHVVNFTRPFFERILQTIIQIKLRDLILDALDEVLSSALNNLNIMDLDFNLNLRGVSGQAVESSVSTTLSDVKLDTSELTIEVSTLTSYQTVVETDMLGVPILTEALDDPLNSGRDLLMRVQLSFVNQLMYTLWRAGFFLFDGGIGEADLAGAGTVNVQVNLLYPPSFRWTGEGRQVYFDFGPADITLTNVDLFGGELSLRLMLTMITDLSIDEDQHLKFGADDFIFEDFHLDLTNVTLTPEGRGTLQNLISILIMLVVYEGINEGLPSIPLPVVRVPSMNTELNLYRPDLSVDHQGIRIAGELEE